MSRDSITNLSFTDFSKAITDKKVVILYPQTPYRTLYLSYLLDSEPNYLLYYSLKDTDTHITDVLVNLIDEYSDIFDDKIKSSLQSNDIQVQAKRFAEALINLNQKLYIYLDELDRLTLDDNYRQFFEILISNLSDQITLFISARAITTEPWRTLVHNGEAVVLGTERRQSQLMFSEDHTDKPQLEIYAFGRGHAIVNGLAVESWDGALPRNLFFYFIDRDLVTRDEIFAAFWPDLQIKEATNVYHVTKRKISERLSMNVYGGGNHELTTYSTGFYRPGDKIIRHYDVAEFEDAVEEASMTFDDDKQAALYRRAIDLYRAPFLLTIEMDWVYERREKLQRLLLEALIGLARIYKSANQHEEALGYFMRAIHEKPLREDIHREVMLLYQQLGYPQESIKQYENLEILLQDTLGVGPASETNDLLQQIKN